MVTVATCSEHLSVSEECWFARSYAQFHHLEFAWTPASTSQINHARSASLIWNSPRTVALKFGRGSVQLTARLRSSTAATQWTSAELSKVLRDSAPNSTPHFLWSGSDFSWWSFFNLPSPLVAALHLNLAIWHGTVRVSRLVCVRSLACLVPRRLLLLELASRPWCGRTTYCLRSPNALGRPHPPAMVLAAPHRRPARTSFLPLGIWRCSLYSREPMSQDLTCPWSVWSISRQIWGRTLTCFDWS